ncbi:hypothetical protein [Stenotrophomonas sp. SY1]|uniref:hypothetical protein n=1 Tax=Stenotrophomonas sp. SY1 TaxID=477235 RepID=UPI001E388FFD|nr:hypothetical protein [Stenotrophomonas sp. SY1]MCD9085476.1 hypothetical protein [Stenotrophomonas sp. SY1]
MQVPSETASSITGKLPFWAWFIIGAALGVALRLLFGMLPRDMQGPMSLAFLVGTPLAVGAITIVGTPRQQRTWSYLIFAPWLAMLLMLLGCALAMLEGSICLALMAPLFFACASVGGLIMGAILHFREAGAAHVSAIAALPLLMLLAEMHMPLVDRDMELRRELVVDATPETIWQQIHSARAIQPQELPLSLTHLIGVPKPLEGINVQTEDGEVRFSRWERGVHFRAHVTHSEANRSVSWRYMFDPDSFPTGSMDEHVAIGGRYFDLRDTTFKLTPIGVGQTHLQIVAHYRLSTTINAYAVPVSRVLGNDFLDTILSLYKRRSESMEKTAAIRAGGS